jgi:hypothetical protein
MQINTTSRHLDSDSVASDLINFLRSNELELELSDGVGSKLHYTFYSYGEIR